jgi:hypothetical protein
VQQIATIIHVAIASSGNAGAQHIATIIHVAIASSGNAGVQQIATVQPIQRAEVPDRS